MVGRGIIFNWLCASAFSVVLTGCASAPSIQSLQRAQQETQEQLQRQKQKIEEQQRRLEFLESERQVLVNAIYAMQNVLQPSAPVNLLEAENAQQEDLTETPAKPSLPQVGFNKIELGRREWVWFDLFGRNVEARIDPAVKSSTIYASNTQLFERDGDEWIRFNLLLDPSEGDIVGGASFEAPVVKRVRVKGSQAGEGARRAVVSLRLQLGELVDEVQFTVANAGDRSAGVVLGRSFLRDIAVVNPNKAFLQPKPVK